MRIFLILISISCASKQDSITELEIYCFNQNNLNYMDCIEIHKIAAKEDEMMRIELEEDDNNEEP